MIAFILACYGVLVYQLYVWQVRDAESYRAEAVTQQLKDTTLPAVRGSIYSANGKLLAKSSTVWNIVADPSSIFKSGATEDQIRTAAEHIAELLDDGTTADTVYKALTASNKDTGEPYQYRVVKKSVEKPVADAILAYADSYRLKDGAAVDTSLQTEEKEDKEDKKDGEAKTSKATRILYLTSEQAASRTYPYGEFLASVLGFCNEDGSGAYGLEKYYDETLAGTPGRSVAETDAYGEPLASGQADVHEAIDGSNLNLTIDENVQSIVEEYLTEAMSTFTVHGRGSAIVMNVKTGAILAMASLEQFDPNDPKTITDPKMNEILAKTEIDAEDIDWLESRLGEKAVKDIIADGIISHEKTTNEKGEEVSSEATQLQGMMREAQWKNKNITELYMPGSVFKLITASAGLDSGVMSAEQTFQRDPLDQRLQRRADGRGRYKPVHGGLRPERVHHPDADGHRRSGHRQRRLPCYALCRGFHLRQGRQHYLPDRDEHPPPGHLRRSQPAAAGHDGKQRPRGRELPLLRQRLRGGLPHRRQVRYGRAHGPPSARRRRLL